jgi:hypothetical protein
MNWWNVIHSVTHYSVDVQMEENIIGMAGKKLMGGLG